MEMEYDEGLEVYTGLPEKLDEEEVVTLSEVTDEYGVAEGSHLIRNGVLIDQRDESINLRESRLGEADMECEQAFDYSNVSLAGSFAKVFGKAAVPVASGYAAVTSGGDPFWVSATGASAYLMKNSIDRSLSEVFEEIGKKVNSKRVEKHYGFNDVEYEDFALNAVPDHEFQELLENTDLEDDLVEAREMPKMQIIAPSDFSDVEVSQVNNP